MDKDEDFNSYEDKIENIDEISGTDVKINPDFYIHSALVKAQEALTSPNIQEGFLKYRVLIEHMEVLCIAAKMLTPDYEKKINEFTISDKYKAESRDEIKSVLLATKKLELMMMEVFSNKVSTQPMKG